MTRIERQTDKIEVPYPQGTPLKLKLHIGAPGKLRVGSGAAGSFVSGTVEYDDDQWEPEVQVGGGTVHIVQAQDWKSKITPSALTPTNTWDLHLGAAHPFDLDVNAPVVRGDWDLTGLPIADLRVETGVSDHRFLFRTPNPTAMDDLYLQAGAGNITVEGLLNAKFERMIVDGGMGNLALSFTGDPLQHDAHVRLGTGVGKYTIVVQKGVAARVKIDGGIGTVTARSGFERSSGRTSVVPFGGEFRTVGYAESRGPFLTIEISAGMGHVTLETD